MVPPPRPGTFSPNPTVQTSHTGISHSPHPSQASQLSAAASPNTSSPTGVNSLTKIVVAQVYLLLSTIREDKDDPNKWDVHIEQLRKLIDDNGMEVFSKYFTRLVAANASQIFPGQASRQAASQGSNHHLLVAEMRKLSHERGQARKIAESVESGTEDIFRDFDLSTFMEHFKLDALEKTILALAFKLGSRSDLRTKADAILSTNFHTFLNILSRVDGDHDDLTPDFVAEIVDQFIQLHPPNFNAAAKSEFTAKVQGRYSHTEQAWPSEVMAALDLMRVLGDKPPNALALYVHRTGPEFTSHEEAGVTFLRNRPNNVSLSEEQVSVALTYTTISQTPRYDPAVLVASLRSILPPSFRWQDVVSYFDQRLARISSEQFLRLYNALLPLAQDARIEFDIQRLWGGEWDNPEAQLSYICAFSSLTPDQLDASTIPGLIPTFTMDEYAQSSPVVRERAAYAARHPLISVAALSAMFNVALHSLHASQSMEAKRLFQEVVVPNLDIFVVSAFSVPKPWPEMAGDTLNSLFENFLYRRSEHYEFVLDSLWMKDKEYVKARLVDTHAVKPMDLPLMLEHAVKRGWLNELVYLENQFAMDLAALAHAEGLLDLEEWKNNSKDRSAAIAPVLAQYLMLKTNMEMDFQRPLAGGVPVRSSTPLQVRTLSALLQILEEFMPRSGPVQELIVLQRACLTAYPRLMNYGEGYDDIIDANGKDGNALPPAANAKMEEHYKKMYGDEVQVKDVVDVLERYKHSRDPLEQDIFACMIHGLFDEYSHYEGYPLEALATTAVLFGGIISHKLISDLPLQAGLGMILQAVRDHRPDEPMYKFGLQALMQLFGRFREWPGFCAQLLQIPGLQGTDAWKKAEDVVRDHEDEQARSRNGDRPVRRSVAPGSEPLANGNATDGLAADQHAPPFVSINVDPSALGGVYEDPETGIQDKIQFVLNNLTETTLQSMFKELRELLDEKYQQWFASHIVEERAKMQPNYHHVYLEVVSLFENKALWSEVLRETYLSVSRMLNSEATMQNSTERTHLKNLGGWLGLLTLARDKPIKHKNIAFKELLIEAHDTKRLTVVIPFVCKVLIQGVTSNVFRPPNPWLMDIIHLLIELYHNAELKLNLKFEIEVLCKGLSLDHKSIEPSGEILNRPPAEEMINDVVTQDAMEAFDSLSLNGIGPAAARTLSPHNIPATIPDLGPNIQIPQTEVVNSSRLHEVVRTALTRALQDIIQPVVDRSVTIAAIATQQMIHKDFATEPDENRLRESAIMMVKATAGSLALVTSKEPLRANFTNYMRTLSAELPLPEGVIIMCVNSNLDLASSVIEKSAEDRAVPEIEDMILPELEARRRHRATRPNEPYVDENLSRWSWTIPAPYKLQPNPSGLNAEQMAIYDDFARQSRSTPTTSAPTHVPSSSDATRSIANEVLQDQFSAVASIPSTETPSLPHMASQVQHYPPQVQNTMTNGRQPGINPSEARVLVERVQKLLAELQRAAAEAREERFAELPRSHAVLEVIDALTQLIIKTQQTSEDFATYAAEQISQILLSHPDDALTLESLVHVLEAVRKIAGPVISQRIRVYFHQQSGPALLHIPLIKALLPTDLLDWRNIDEAVATILQQRKPTAIQFFENLLDQCLTGENPVALYADFVRSLEEAWTWITEEPDVPGGESLKMKILQPAPPLPPDLSAGEVAIIRQEQMEYVFEEWVQLCNNPNASHKSETIFVQQMNSRTVVVGKDDLFVFIRLALDTSIERFEQNIHAGSPLSDAYQAVDALVRMVVILLESHVDDAEGRSFRATFFDSVVSLVIIILNHHHYTRGTHFNQKVFFRFFAMLLTQTSQITDKMTEFDWNQIILKFASRLSNLEPSAYPGFVYAWLGLIHHRVFMPTLLSMADEAGWAPFTRLLKQLLGYLGEQLKFLDVSPIAKDIYRAVLKLVVVLQHDFPEFMAVHHVQLCESVPPHCAQLLNMILVATPPNPSKLPDLLRSGPKGDRSSETPDALLGAEDPAGFLEHNGLLGILEETLQNGPTEDAIAQIAHAINSPEGQSTTFGHVPVGVNIRVIDAVVSFIGAFAVSKRDDASPPFVPGASDVKALFMLVTELGPEARYYLLTSMVNQLRFANNYTQYFSQALLDIFGHDLSDPEEGDIRQQIVRILLERLVGFWPHPWGLMVTVIELVKNDKYMFFEQPFIKSAPEVAERFAAVLQPQRG